MANGDDDAIEAVVQEDEQEQEKEGEQEDNEAESEVEATEEVAAVEATASVVGDDESSSSSDSDYDSDSDNSSSEGYDSGGYEDGEEARQVDNSPEANFRDFSEVLDSRTTRRREEEEEQDYAFYEDLFDFPRDREKWREEDIRELWADAPVGMTKPGWDPVFADEDDWEVVMNEARAGRRPPIAPFYLPYRKPYPAIPDNHYDISNPKSVVEELDRIEEFLKWVSYVFEDGSTYEGTVWDDLANGKGVYVAEDGLVRYEGEWLQNEMEGHGVVEVDIPDVEPVPGSKLEAKMRAEGKIISRDFMSPEDKRWLEMDIEDSMLRAGNRREIPFYERDEWIKVFGQKPERGRYRYAGQWKHGRMHGCGVYEVNERMIHGRFYFGEYMEDPAGCDSDVSTLHAGIAEVAAAKARMFVNKPDGMVREERGPYNDPQHPYFYEEDDVCMAPGFINQFYEVPDYWKVYVQEVDQERDMWLNSFYKAPLRIPMPAELEHWWSKGDDDSEFVLINKEPEPDPEDPSKLIYTEDPLILHTRTGRLINYVDDEKHGVRLFWQPYLKEGEDVDPQKAEFLPLGYDEFFGRATPVEKDDGKFMGLVSALKKTFKPQFDRVQKWAEEQKKVREMNRNLIEQELEFIEAEICLDEAIEDMELELKEKQKEEEKRAVESSDTVDSDASAVQDVGPGDMENEDEDEDEDNDEDGAPTSFGTVNSGKIDDGPKESKPGKVPFSSLSLSSPVGTLVPMVPTKLLDSFLSWRKSKHLNGAGEQSSHKKDGEGAQVQIKTSSVQFPAGINLRKDIIITQTRPRNQKRQFGQSQLYSLARILSSPRSAFKDTTGNPASSDNFSILSLHVPVPDAPT